MKDEIFCKIKKYTDQKPSIWHTPGHKGLLSRYDITEIDDTFPASSIRNAEQRAAMAFGAKAVRFLTGGSSMGIKAGLMSLPGDVLIESNSHRAVHEGLKLGQKKFIIVDNLVKNDLPVPLSAQQIDLALSKNKTIKTVLIASPDYYGQVAEVLKILEVIKKHNAFFYVDSAHGAHFDFRKDLFPLGFTSVADVCNISAHKTLPSFTQSAYLCINNESLLPSIDENLALLGTTSPSYLLYSGLEYAIDYCERNSANYDVIYAACNRLKSNIKCLENSDFTRIVVDAEFYDMKGYDLYFELKKEGVIAEKYDDRYVVFIVSIVDTAEDINKLSCMIQKVLESSK